MTFLNKHSQKKETENQADSSFIYHITPEAMHQIMNTVGIMRPEELAILGEDIESGIITSVHYDSNAQRTYGECSPDTKSLQEVINQWKTKNIRFRSVTHSHPGKHNTPSEGDRIYAERILRAMPQTLNNIFLMPIVNVDEKNHMSTIHPYVAVLDAETDKVSIRKAQIYIGDDLLNSPLKWEDWVDSYQTETQEDNSSHENQECEEIESTATPTTAGTDENTDITTDPEYVSDQSEPCDDKPKDMNTLARFERIKTALPLNHLAEITVVFAGCGGARGSINHLARNGICRFVLIDGDNYEEKNIGTQECYTDEVGAPKVDAIERELHRIDPNIEVVKKPAFLDDNMSDEELETAIGKTLLDEHPENVLFFACADNFPPQDRAAKLALKWGVPFLAAQNYEKGLAGEIVFTYPGVTPACPRCILSSRYRAYENPSEVKPVTSDGALPDATDHLNAEKLHIAMMLMTYGTDCDIGKELDLIKDYNLVMLSNSPNSEQELGIRSFSKEYSGLDNDTLQRLLIGGVAWRLQKPDRPENGYPHCPYCGGTGDLRMIRGMISDTRKPWNLQKFIQSVQTQQN